MGTHRANQPGGKGSDQLPFFTLRLKVDTDHDGGMVFYSMASDLLPDQPLLGVSTSCTDVFSWFVLLGTRTAIPTCFFKCIFITTIRMLQSSVLHTTRYVYQKEYKYLPARNKQSWAQIIPISRPSLSLFPILFYFILFVLFIFVEDFLSRKISTYF